MSIVNKLKPIILLLCLLMVACGGGGGNSDVNNDNLIDTSPPTASITPGNGETISITSPIVITFSEEIDTRSLVSTGSMWTESDRGVWSKTNHTNDTLTISPATQWSTGNSRILTIETSDLAGNNITVNLSYVVSDDLDSDGSPLPLDCDDNNPTIYPGAPELCDNADNDCDTEVDEGFACTCGTDQTPPGGICPAQCSYCNAATCYIECPASGCVGTTVTCPSGFSCNISCSGTNACENTSLNCPENYPCDVTCDGNNACSNTSISCGTNGTCDLSCSATVASCNSTTIQVCGDNQCTASCSNPSIAPNVICGNTCNCDTSTCQ